MDVTTVNVICGGEKNGKLGWLCKISYGLSNQICPSTSTGLFQLNPLESKSFVIISYDGQMASSLALHSKLL